MNPLTYYDTGEQYFDSGYPIYINTYSEPVQKHLHSHDFIEISYVISGQGIHIIEDKEYRVSQGDLFFINYNIPHEFRSLNQPDSQPLVINNCVFKPEFLDSTMAECKNFFDLSRHLLFRSLFPVESDTNINFQLISVNRKEIEDIYKKMNKEFQRKEDGYIELLRLYVTELMIIIFRTMRKTEFKPNKNNSNSMMVVNKIMDYIENHYRSMLNLKDLSMMLFLSPNYISKIFKDCEGITLTEYIQNKRIEEACRLLRETDQKIIVIAGEIGYKDLKHFQSIFKKVTGMTPGSYRRLYS
jgi:AraC-type DNA-binding domain-containing proteins